MAHKGIRTYTADEISNIALGQSGFDVINGGTKTPADKGFTGHWIAFKAVNGASNVIGLTPDEYPGDHFTQSGLSGGAAVAVPDGETVYGCFNSINSSAIVIAYRG